MLQSNIIRKRFVDFFKQHGHQHVNSSSLAHEDPSLLFPNAGMNQFKQVFLGGETRPYNKAVTFQKCLRAGGKHNDLDNVGKTSRHHTFFEMLGNFSFGDYGKAKAIDLAWTFLTVELGIDPDRLLVTVYEDDDEAYDIWHQTMGLDQTRIIRCGDEDNFWSMGQQGPCGPCTEIFFDHGAQVDGGPPGSNTADGDRFVEVWNIVFMQYDRDAKGALHKLPKLSVDTGMGLERITAVMQSCHDNFATDLFVPLIQAIDTIAKQQSVTLSDLTRRVTADHLRAAIMLMADGIRPGNDGRSYVLRRIMRRALRLCYQDGLVASFFEQLLPIFIDKMQDAYPGLSCQQDRIADALIAEQMQFANTYQQGVSLLQAAMTNASGKRLDATTVFKLYDTYGFPIDLTRDMASEQGFEIDEQGFEACMADQRQRSRSAQQFTGMQTYPGIDAFDSRFLGYDHEANDAIIQAIYIDDQSVDRLDADQRAVIILDASAFYPQGGGQVGDIGLIQNTNATFVVDDTQCMGKAILHYGHMTMGQLRTHDKVEAQVDVCRRHTKRNHSATHLLHAALRLHLGESVEQKGSLVSPQRLRFDCAYPKAISSSQIQAIEKTVNTWIMQNLDARTIITTPDKAKAMGAVALFGERYGDEVRVCAFGDQSMELCGGTHVQSTGEIGGFKIINQGAIAAGIRRLEAVTGEHYLAWSQEQSSRIEQIADMLNTDAAAIDDRLTQLIAEHKQLKKNQKQQSNKQSQLLAQQLWQSAQVIGDMHIITAQCDSDMKALRSVVDELKSRADRVAIALISQDTKRGVLVGLSSSLVDQGHRAQPALKAITSVLGGSGGGRDDFAQGSVSSLDQVDDAWDQFKEALQIPQVS